MLGKLSWFPCALAVAVTPNIALAYLDPGSFNFTIQAVFGVVIGGLYALKLYWSRIKLKLSSLLRRQSK